jgi:hypothetical protein
MTELYKFTGSTTYGFTPHILSKSFESVTYAPTIVKRSAINIEDNFAKNNVSFSFLRTHFYAKELLIELPETPVLVNIYRTSDATYAPYWSGRVIGATLRGIHIEIHCDSIYSKLRRGGLSPKVGLLCRHALYSENCGVSQGLWGVSYSVDISSTEVAVSGLAEPAGYYNNGIAVIAGQQRRIVTNTTTHIYLSAPFSRSLSGTVTLYPGCALTETACTGFNNLDNFGGFSRLPQKNPFSNTGLL